MQSELSAELPGLLRQARWSAGKTVTVVAVEARMDPGHLSRIERGAVLPGVAILLRLADVLELTELADALRPYVATAA